MNRIYIFIFVILIMPMQLSAQVVYDTIPKEQNALQIIGRFYLLSFPEVKDIDSQLNSRLNHTDFTNPGYRSGTVVVSTVFGKSGEQRETKILKPLTPYCDSIAFYAVSGLNDWIPAVQRAHYTDFDFLLPIHFPDRENQEGFHLNISFLNNTPSEYESAKRKYDFYTSKDKNQTILNNFDYLKDYVADQLSDTTYVHISELNKPKRKDRVKLDIVNARAPKIPFLIRDSEKNGLLFYTRPKKKLFLEKGKKYQMIGFQPEINAGAKLSIDTFIFENDTVFSPEFKYTTKTELLNALENF